MGLFLEFSYFCEGSVLTDGVDPNSKDGFPLGEIFRTEGIFICLKGQLAETGRRRTKEIIVPRRYLTSMAFTEAFIP